MRKASWKGTPISKHTQNHPKQYQNNIQDHIQNHKKNCPFSYGKPFKQEHKHISANHKENILNSSTKMAS